ncbi:retrotransposon protein, putative, ty1-copia subclass [Tanacetum coccineum]
MKYSEHKKGKGYIPPPPKKEHLTKDSICHHCHEVGHWRRNCHAYLAELNNKKKNTGLASTSDIFTIELYSFPNKSLVYDTGCGIHIFNTTQGLRGSRNLKQGALNLYVCNRMRATIEAIGSFDLILPNGLIIVLENCHFAPTITRGIVSLSCMVDNGFIHSFTDYGISVSKDNVIYFNAIQRDGIYEIDLIPNSGLILQEASGSNVDLEVIQDMDTQPSKTLHELRDFNEPTSYTTALSNLKPDKWVELMNVKMHSMKDNQVWLLIDIPLDCRTIGSQWLFKKKTDTDGNIHTLKACLVANSYTQTYGIDYEETFYASLWDHTYTLPYVSL